MTTQLYQEKLTREQAVAECGERAVKALEAANAEFAMSSDREGMIQFSAGINLPADCEAGYTLEAIYYQTPEAVNDETRDLDDLAWAIDHYRIS
jgi:hypothetical protein